MGKRARGLRGGRRVCSGPAMARSGEDGGEDVVAGDVRGEEAGEGSN